MHIRLIILITASFFITKGHAKESNNCALIDKQINLNKQLTKSFKFSLAVNDMEQYIKECIVINEHGSKAHVKALNQLVYAKFKSRHVTQEKDKTIEEAHRAVNLSKELYGINHAITGYAYSNLGNIFMTIGDYKKALSQHIISLKIREKVLPKQHEDIGTSYNDVAYSYRHLQKFDESRSASEKSILIRKAALPKNHPDIGWSINNLANLLSDLEHYEESIKLYNEALDIFNISYKPDSPAVAGVINNIGTIYHLTGELEKVEPYYQQALTSYEKAYGYSHPQVALVLNNLGELYLETGKEQKALEFFEKSVDIRIKINGHYNSNVAWTYSYIAQLLFDKGLFEDAESYIELALSVWYQLNGELPLNRLSTLSLFAKVAEQQGKYVVAYDRYSNLVNTSINLLTNLASDTTDFSNAKTIISPVLVNIFEFLSSSEVKTNLDKNAQNYLSFKAMQIENWSAVAVDSAISHLSDNNSNQLLKTFHTQQNSRNAINKNLLFALRNKESSASKVNKLRFELSKKDDEISLTKELIRSTNQENSNYLFPLDVELVDVRAKLDQRQILLQYYWGKNKSYLLATTTDATRLIELELNKKQINILVDKAYSSLNISSVKMISRIRPFDLDLSYQIYGEILAPALINKPEIDSISVVSSGAINKFPMHLLVTEKPSLTITSITDFKHYDQVKWLFKKYSVETLTSLISPNSKESNKIKRSLLAIGSPILSNEGGQLRGVQQIEVFNSKGLASPKTLRELPRLKHSESELRSGVSKIGNINSTILIGKNATETLFRENIKQNYGFIAISSHALLATGGEIRPQHSIVLTPPLQSSEKDDGLLTSDEIRKLQLNTKLVILSGCNTAASENGNNLGDLSGLASSFIYAGSENVLVTLWQIEDKSTSKLMKSFYSSLDLSNLSVKDSLKEAMLIQLQADDLSIYKHPVFWGGFQSVKSSL